MISWPSFPLKMVRFRSYKHHQTPNILSHKCRRNSRPEAPSFSRERPKARARIAIGEDLPHQLVDPGLRAIDAKSGRETTKRPYRGMVQASPTWSVARARVEHWLISAS